MSFDTLGLTPALLRALNDAGYTEATPIQTGAIPLVLAGHDLLAGAQTGTGKTAAFGLPVLQKLAADATVQRRPRALILTPTRELSAQVADSLRSYGKHLSLRITTVFGGVGMQPQVEALRRGVDILVATPGRLIDHIDRGSVDLSQIRMLVLDEADRMLDMGFLPAIQRILKRLPPQRQTLLFSATFAPEIKALAQQFMHNPQEVQVTPSNSTAPRVRHLLHPVDSEKKRDLLLHVLGEDSRRQTLVFCRTKHGSDKVQSILERAGLRAAAIHGNKSQNARTRALSDFKSGRINVLVATDIAARGIDIDQLPAVINLDLPNVPEDYVHRIGRTGRAGADGLAISLVSSEESDQLRAIERLLGNAIEKVEVDGFIPTRPLKMTPAGRQAQPGAGRPAPGKPRRPPAHRGNPTRGTHTGRHEGKPAGDAGTRPPRRAAG